MSKLFDIEKAKAGAPVRTRDGRNARIICWDFNCVAPECKIIALVSDGEKETACCYNEDGEFAGRKTESEFDLVTRIHKEGFILIHKDIEEYRAIVRDGTTAMNYTCYETYEDAEKDANDFGLDAYIGHIEWEE